MKTELINDIKSNGWIIDILESTCIMLKIKKYTQQDIINYEQEVYVQNRDICYLI